MRGPVREHFRPIEDYGVVGDCASAALISSDGSIDWWCPGRFDAPSAFAALLDCERGGFFRIHDAGRSASEMAYVPRTNVLRTEWRSPAAAFEVFDFLPLPSAPGERGHRIVRFLRGLRGESRVRVEFAPRLGYGAVETRVDADGPGRVVATGDGESLDLVGPGPFPVEDGRAAFATEVVREGEVRAWSLLHRPRGAPPVPGPDPSAALDATIEWWLRWLSANHHDGAWNEAVLRSALVLKLLTHEPTGAVVAAPTSSLPEWVGGVRNWDYRFSWVRDAVFAVRALAEVGHMEEARRFVDWIVRTSDPDPAKLRVLYGLGGAAHEKERTLDHLSGYRGSRPVRVGNAAEEQFQLDVGGELMEGAYACGLLRSPDPATWDYFRRLADFVADAWRRPDQGIWEVRCPPEHFVHSKVLAWAALDRAARAATENGLPGDVARWRKEAEAVHDEVLREGWDPGMGAFKQSYGRRTLDAANLLIPVVGFLPGTDPRVVSTIDRTIERLTSNGLVYRYLDADDGLPGAEATFTYCTFWLVEALALAGRVDEARRWFEGVLARASPLGLFAEELDPATGDHLGNYPQGFPHIGLIRAAARLRRLSLDGDPRPAASPVRRRSRRARLG